MSDTRYIIEISQPTTDAGVNNVNRVGDLILSTSDPVAAVDFRKTLRTALGADYALKLVMAEEKRSTVITAFDEDHFRRARPRDNAIAAAADREGGAQAGFDTEMNEQGAAWKSLKLLDEHLTGDRALDGNARENVWLTLDYYDLGSGVARGMVRNDTAPAELLRDLAVTLSAKCRSFPIKEVEPVDSERWIAVCKELAQHSPDALSKPDAKACERESDLDYLACKGRIVEVTFVNGYDLGTNNQNDLVSSRDEAPYRVVICGADATPSQWNDDTLDPKWDVRPAPDETRLDGLRSLWTFGPSYRDATLSQQEG